MLCGAICGALHCYAGYAVLCGALLLILGVYVESLYASLNTANILVPSKSKVIQPGFRRNPNLS